MRDAAEEGGTRLGGSYYLWVLSIAGPGPRGGGRRE